MIEAKKSVFKHKPVYVYDKPKIAATRHIQRTMTTNNIHE